MPARVRLIEGHLVGQLEVGGPDPPRGEGSSGELLGLVRECRHPLWGDEPGQLGVADLRQAATGLGDHGSERLARGLVDRVPGTVHQGQSCCSHGEDHSENVDGVGSRRQVP